MVNQFRHKLEQLKGQRNQIKSDISRLTTSIDEGGVELRRIEKAREIIKQVGLQTQQQLSYNIGNISSMALEAIMDDPYELEVEFVERRNKTECDIWFKRGEERINPFDGGGGAVDIASFALRVASWSMQHPRTRNVLILDEPFKHLKGEQANRKMLDMLKQISEKLEIQIIMVSDERVSREATIEHTDCLLEVRINKGISKVE